MVSNPVPLKPPPCLRADVDDADLAIDRVPAPSSSVILIANAIPLHTDPTLYRFCCWVLVNSDIVYSCRFTDQLTLDAFVGKVRIKLATLMPVSAIVDADARGGTSTLPCPPPDDLTSRRQLISSVRAAAPRTR
jgi:hypothetical protein